MIAMPDPSTFAVLPWRPEEQGVGADVLRHPGARRRALRGRPALDPAPRARARRGRWASTPSTSAPSSSTSTSSSRQARGRHARGPRRGRLLRPDDARRRLRRAPRDGARARAARHPRRVHPPRGRPLPARGRHALQGRAEDGRRLHDLPDHGQGVRDEVRLARDLHAEAAVRRERLRACTRTSRCSRTAATPSSTPTTSTSSRDVGKAFIAGQLKHAREICAALRPVGQLLQAPGARLRGAGLPRLVAAQPLGADPGAALPPRQGAGDARGAALPGPGLQPLPAASRRCCTPASRGSRRATSCPSRWSRTSTT